MIKKFNDFVNENLTSLVDRYKNQKGERLEDLNCVLVSGKKLTWDDINSSWIYEKRGKDISLIGYYYYDEDFQWGDAVDEVGIYRWNDTDGYEFPINYPHAREDISDMLENGDITENDSTTFYNPDEVIDDFKESEFSNGIKILNLKDLTEKHPDGFYIDISK